MSSKRKSKYKKKTFLTEDEICNIEIRRRNGGFLSVVQVDKYGSPSEYRTHDSVIIDLARQEYKPLLHVEVTNPKLQWNSEALHGKDKVLRNRKKSIQRKMD